MRFLEKTGRTVDTAVSDALIELGATSDEVTVEVLEKGSKGFLGIGAKDAKVRVTVKEISEEPIVAEEAPKKVEVVPEPKVQEEKVVQPTEPTAAPKVKAPIDTEKRIACATTFLTKVLKEMQIEATFESKIEGDRVCINITGEKMGVVIGKRGETLDALQYLTNIVVNKGNEGYTKIMLDTENYRVRREETLQKVALKYAKKATQLKRPVTLEPMNPYDRRIIHSVLQNSKYVKTHSEGKEPFRKVVITPLNQNKTYNKK